MTRIRTTTLAAAQAKYDNMEPPDDEIPQHVLDAARESLLEDDYEENITDDMITRRAEQLMDRARENKSCRR